MKAQIALKMFGSFGRLFLGELLCNNKRMFLVMIHCDEDKNTAAQEVWTKLKGLGIMLSLSHSSDSWKLRTCPLNIKNWKLLSTLLHDLQFFPIN